MNLLFRVIHGSICRSTHHKLAIDALRYLRGEHAADWRNLYLHYHQHYLKGSKDPDTEFKDFRNHVLHVSDNYWGGACKASMGWYNVTLEALKNKSWQFAVYDAGALSHYYVDPIMPFHTGQSEAESQVHRAVEWSICKSYDKLVNLVPEDKHVDMELATGDDWLDQMVKRGAEYSHQHYKALIEHYDFHLGVKDPPAGLDDHSQRIVGDLLRYAAVGFARILERVFEEGGEIPPKVDPTLKGLVETTKIPLRTLMRSLADAKDQAQVKAIYNELQTTGRVEKTLPEDDRVVRELYFREVINPKRQRAQAMASAQPESQPAREETKPEPVADNKPKSRPKSKASQRAEESKPMSQEPPQTESKPVEESAPSRVENDAMIMEHSADVDEGHRRGSSPRNIRRPMGKRTNRADPTLTGGGGGQFLRFCYNLELTSDVEAAPSIGAKTAQRLYEIGVSTVGDLLAMDPAEAERKLDARHITAQVFRDWQDQAALVLRVPRLKGHDAQILVACDYRDPEEIAVTEPEELLDEALEFVNSKKGQRLLRSSKKPDLDEVSRWVEWAQYSRTMSDVGLELES